MNEMNESKKLYVPLMICIPSECSSVTIGFATHFVFARLSTSSMASKSFTINRGLVGVEAEHMGPEPWLVPVKRQRVQVFELEFFELNMQDRRLAKALGLDCSKRSPFEGTTVLSYLAKLRNKKVDDLIMRHLTEEDPMAEAALDGDEGAPTTDRAKKFAAAKVKQVLEITTDEFTKENGDVIDPKVLKIYATPRRDSILTLELSAANLSWLSIYVHHDELWAWHPQETLGEGWG